MTSITIPATVTSIGRHTFAGCTGLKEVTFTFPLPEFEDFDYNDEEILRALFGDDGILTNAKWNGILPVEDVISEDTIGEDDIPLASLYIPDGIKEIVDIFNSREYTITSIVIPESVVEIGAAFQRISTLKEVTIPASVKKMSLSAFDYSGLSSITFLGTVSEFKEISFFDGIYFLDGITTFDWDTAKRRFPRATLVNCVIHCKDGNIEN